MKTSILLGTTLLLSLGTAVGGSSFYGQSASDEVVTSVSTFDVAAPEPTPAMIAMWKATAASTDYVAPKAPI